MSDLKTLTQQTSVYFKLAWIEDCVFDGRKKKMPGEAKTLLEIYRREGYYWVLDIKEWQPQIVSENLPETGEEMQNFLIGDRFQENPAENLQKIGLGLNRSRTVAEMTIGKQQFGFWRPMESAGEAWFEKYQTYEDLKILANQTSNNIINNILITQPNYIWPLEP